MLRDQGQLGDAHAAVERSLTVFRQLDNEPGQAWALQSLGDVCVREDRLGDAGVLLEQALGMAYRLGISPCQARAPASLDGLTAGVR